VFAFGKPLIAGWHVCQCPALGTAAMVEIGATVAATATSMVAEAQQSKANASRIEQQETLQQNQIAQQTGNTESAAAKQARAARAESIVAAGAAGISTGSNSFLASLQTTTMEQSTSTQLLNESERNSEAGSQAQANTQLATAASHPSIFGAALSGASAYVGADMMEQAGKRGVPSDPGSSAPPAAYHNGGGDM
jgi:hypothetical protein